MGRYKYIIASVTLHGLLMVAIILDWGHNNLHHPIDTDVLLLGESTNTRVTAQKSPRQKAKASATSEVVDPDALKTAEVKTVGPATSESEGSFGQGGKAALKYDDELAAWIQANKKYPKFAKRLGQECSGVRVEATVYPDGHLDNMFIAEKCQHEMLNQAALEAVKASNPFRPFPPELGKAPRKGVYVFTFEIINQ